VKAPLGKPEGTARIATTESDAEAWNPVEARCHPSATYHCHCIADGLRASADWRGSMIHCVLHDPDDSVAVVVVEGVKAGTALTGLILDEDRTITLECVQDIPIGHKVALRDMAVGDTVIKYGVDIGRVVQRIRKGEHAHVHNIKTKRW
jgi:(2R)-sulfolactate sulfo-lyase subunit alpha